jgi:transposase
VPEAGMKNSEESIGNRPSARSPPDFASMHEQMRQHRHLTLQLLWEEYRQADPEGYRYSRFCELYQRWRSKLDVVLRQEHKAGEKMFVDWAGSTIAVSDRHTGMAWPGPLFVAALGASSYTWAEATRDQQMEAWLRAHVHAFEHFGGIPALAVPDNTKTGVTKAHRYDPDLNPTYYNFAMHCGFGIVPATGTHDGKTDGHAAARHGGRFENTRTRSGFVRAALPGTALPAGGSAMDLARESGPGTATACRQVEGCLRGRH